MAGDALQLSLQEDVLTLLCYDDTHGKIIANMVTADLFEGDYKPIAEKALEFWRVHRGPPVNHTPDLVANILRDNQNPRRASLLTSVLVAMHEVHTTINTKYVMSQLMNFIRLQQMKAAIIMSAEKLKAAETVAIRDIEHIWSDMLRAQEIGFDAGMRLTQVNDLLALLERRQSEFVTGIGVYDKLGIVPVRGTLGAMLAVPGDGKTWYLIHVGKHNLMRGKRVLHLTLEFDVEFVIQRYMQALFAITKYKVERVDVTRLVRNEYGRLREFRDDIVRPEFSFASPSIKEELETRLEIMGAMANNLVVKRFPPNRIEERDVSAYLDGLANNERFEPDLILYDAPYLYKMDRRDPRRSLGEHVLNTRAQTIERNVAGVMVHQIGRGGAREGTRRATDIAEDWSIVMTCDRIDTLSKTSAEARLGLARLFADKARTDKDKFETLITQNYETGQFCLTSMPMDGRYQKMLKEFAGDDEDNDRPRDEHDDD